MHFSHLGWRPCWTLLSSETGLDGHSLIFLWFFGGQNLEHQLVVVGPLHGPEPVLLEFFFSLLFMVHTSHSESQLFPLQRIFCTLPSKSLYQIHQALGTSKTLLNFWKKNSQYLQRAAFP